MCALPLEQGGPFTFEARWIKYRPALKKRVGDGLRLLSTSLCVGNPSWAQIGSSVRDIIGDMHDVAPLVHDLDQGLSKPQFKHFAPTVLPAFKNKIGKKLKSPDQGIVNVDDDPHQAILTGLLSFDETDLDRVLANVGIDSSSSDNLKIYTEDQVMVYLIDSWVAKIFGDDVSRFDKLMADYIRFQLDQDVVSDLEISADGLADFIVDRSMDLVDQIRGKGFSDLSEDRLRKIARLAFRPESVTPLMRRFFIRNGTFGVDDRIRFSFNNQVCRVALPQETVGGFRDYFGDLLRQFGDPSEEAA